MVKTADYAFITEHAVRRFLERVCEMPYAGMSDAEAKIGRASCRERVCQYV